MASDPPATDEKPSVGSYSVSPFLKREVSDQIRNRDARARTSWNWYDTWQEEHCRAFVVAKLCKADLLQEVHDSLQKAVDTGMTFAEWKKKIEPKLNKVWIGQTVGDLWDDMPPEERAKHTEPTAEERKREITPKRLETIYRTNMKVAHAAGQYQSMKDMAELYPYWCYYTQDDDKVRGDHKAMHRKVFRHDDPFWDTHYPPNGWNCRCYVRAMDEMDLEDEGLTVTKSEDLKKIPQTGEASGRDRLAYGIGEEVATTEDGWNYNPGKVSAQLAAMAKKKAKKYDPALKGDVIGDVEPEIKAEGKREQKGQEVPATSVAPTATTESTNKSQNLPVYDAHTKKANTEPDDSDVSARNIQNESATSHTPGIQSTDKDSAEDNTVKAQARAASNSVEAKPDDKLQENGTEAEQPSETPTEVHQNTEEKAGQAQSVGDLKNDARAVNGDTPNLTQLIGSTKIARQRLIAHSCECQ